MNYPFKVICVTTKDFNGDAYHDYDIEVGDRFTAIGESIGYGTKGIACICYAFAGFPEDDLFDKRNFAILPSTTEEIGIEAESEAIIYQR